MHVDTQNKWRLLFKAARATQLPSPTNEPQPENFETNHYRLSISAAKNEALPILTTNRARNGNSSGSLELGLCK